MSLFDHRYYALTKAHMSRVGIWPEQSRCVRITLPSTLFAVALTLAGPGIIRLRDCWRDINIAARNTTFLLAAIAVFVSMFSFIHHGDNIKLSLKNIKRHWEMLKNTPAVMVLDAYAERGRYITVLYLIYFYSATILCFCLCLSPTILDFVDPLNETRPKVYIVAAEYGIDEDKYYCFILAHTYIVVGMCACILVAMATMYILWVVHACALFEAVGFKLELISYDNTVDHYLRSDWKYNQICECIILHIEALSFAHLVEKIFSTTNGVAFGVTVIIAVISGVQGLINWKHPEVLIQQVTLVIGQIFHLYIGSIPGQEMMNHSGKIHTTAYNSNWQDMPVNAQKLLIPILIRSSIPCYFTAAKVYVLTMETFNSPRLWSCFHGLLWISSTPYYTALLEVSEPKLLEQV